MKATIKNAPGFKLIFWLRRNKVTKQGLSPVYLRITQRGDISNISTGVFINPDMWPINPKNPDSAIIAEQLRVIENQLQLHLPYLKERERIEMLIKWMSGRPTIKELDSLPLTTKPTAVRSIINAHFEGTKKAETVKELHSVYIADNSHYISARLREKYYPRYLNIFCQFSRLEYGTENPSVKLLNARTFNSFYTYLRFTRKYRYGSLVKFISYLRALTRYAVVEGIITDHSSLAFRPKSYGENKEIQFLTMSKIRELHQLQGLSIPLKIVRDLFVFQCFTGLAYADISELSKEHLTTDQSGLTWIVKRRQKSNIRQLVPLNEICKRMIEEHQSYWEDKSYLQKRFSFHYRRDKIFPVIVSNQKFNRNLKQLGAMIGFNGSLTSHIGRKSFACNALNDSGVSLETVSAMLGHTKTATTLKHYARVDERRIIQEMSNFSFMIS